VKADELIRKPFQPQELIGRVKSLLEPKRASDAPVAERPAAASVLNSLFAPPAPVAPRPVASLAPSDRIPESIWPRVLAEAFTSPRPGDTAAPAAPQHSQQAGGPSGRPAPTTADIQKLRSEIARLDLLVKKLQTEMQIERQYTQALELQIQTLTRVD
jgi:DNA-binding response OmpR family regulator